MNLIVVIFVKILNVTYKKLVQFQKIHIFISNQLPIDTLLYIITI